jgi:hypothetical protein
MDADDDVSTEFDDDPLDEERWCHTCRGEGWGISGNDWPWGCGSCSFT